MTRKTKAVTGPDEARKAWASFDRATDRLAAVLGGEDEGDARIALDGLMGHGPAAAVGVLGIALRRAGGDAARRARLARHVGAVGSYPRARRPAIALLFDSVGAETDRHAAMALIAALMGLQPTREETAECAGVPIPSARAVEPEAPGS